MKENYIVVNVMQPKDRLFQSIDLIMDMWSMTKVFGGVIAGMRWTMGEVLTLVEHLLSSSMN
jgi:hypothetical protein